MKTKFLFSACAMIALAACQSAGTNQTGPSAGSGSLAALPSGYEAEDAASADQAVDVENDKDATTVGAVQEAKSVNASARTSDPDTILAYQAPKTGTVFTWKNNWANLPERISYKVAGKVTKGETEYVRFSSIEGFKTTTHAYYDTRNFALKGYRDKSDKAVITFKPPEQRYRFPMKPGSQWITKWKQLDHKTKRVTSGGGVVKVMRWETLNLPAGKIRALKVRMPVQRDAPKGLTHYAWFSPELGVTVKEEIGGGVLNWSQVLERVEHPG